MQVCCNSIILLFRSDDINHGIYIYALDIDECGIPGLGGMCSQICVNTPGSYECQCNNGYRLSSDGFTCEGIYIATAHNICSMALGDDACNAACMF